MRLVLASGNVFYSCLKIESWKIVKDKVCKVVNLIFLILKLCKIGVSKTEFHLRSLEVGTGILLLYYVIITPILS